MIMLPDALKVATREILDMAYGENSLLVCVNPESGMRVLYHKQEVHPLLSFHCINPPMKIAVGRGLKAQTNMAGLNHFVYESDTATIEEQLQILESFKSKIFLAVFSGNKSIHFHLITKNGFSSIAEYKEVYEIIGGKLFTGNLAGKYDPQCNDPARLTRLPNGINHKTGLPQKVIHFDPGSIIADDFTPELIRVQTERHARECSLGMKFNNSRSENLESRIPRYQGIPDDPTAFKRFACPVTASYAAGVAVLDGKHTPGTGHDTLVKGLMAIYRFRPYDGEYVYSEEFIMRVAEIFPRDKVQDSREIARWVIEMGR